MEFLAESKIFKSGNSLAVRIPAEIRKRLELSDADEVIIEVDDADNIIIKKKKNAVSLAEMLDIFDFDSEFLDSVKSNRSKELQARKLEND